MKITFFKFHFLKKNLRGRWNGHEASHQLEWCRQNGPRQVLNSEKLQNKTKWNCIVFGCGNEVRRKSYIGRKAEHSQPDALSGDQAAKRVRGYPHHQDCTDFAGQKWDKSTAEKKRFYFFTLEPD